MNVYQHDEEGLQSVAINPNFAKDNWVYVSYSPPLDTPADDAATPVSNEGDAPDNGTAGAIGEVQGRDPAVALQAQGQSG